MHLEAEEVGTTTVGKYSKTIMAGHNLGMGWDAGYSKREDSREETEAGRLVFPALPSGESRTRAWRAWRCTPRTSGT